MTMRSVGLFGMVLALGAMASCGTEDPTVTLGAQLRLDAQVASQIDRFDIYVLGPKMSDGKFLPCSLLRLETVDPTGSQVDLLASRTGIVFDGAGGAVSGGATVSDIPAGKDRVVYVAAYGGTNIVANGCQEQVEVASGTTKSVTIDIYPL